MPNLIKYSTTGDTLSLKKGNFYIGVGDVGKGPTEITGYWNGVDVPSGGYVIHKNKSVNGPAMWLCKDDAEFVYITNNIEGTTFTGATQSLAYYSPMNDAMVFNRNYETITTNGLVLLLDAGFTPSYPRINEFLGDLGGNILYNVKNFGIPLNEWYVRRSDISLITDGSITPPYSGAQVWSSTINTSLYPNTLHRTWPDGSVKGIIGNLGQGFYRYYMWVRGKSTNSVNASISIDISDGSTPGNSGNVIIGTNENWQLLSCWDNGGFGYNVAKFFDYFLTGVNGDTYYISGISIVRSDVTDVADLKPLFTFPGYLNYSATKISELDGVLTNGPTFSTDGGGSIVFDGTDDYVTLGTQSLITNNFTINLWYNLNTNTTKEHFLFSVGYSSANSFLISTNSTLGGSQSIQSYYLSAGGNATGRTINSTTITNTQIVNLTYTRNDGLNVIYINGVEQTSRTFTESLPLGLSLQYILGYAIPRNKTTAYLQGNIYINQIYNRPLSSDEVLQNFNAQKSRFGL